MAHLSRRHFLKGSALAAGSFFISSHLKAQSANQNVGMAVIGLNGKGKSAI